MKKTPLKAFVRPLLPPILIPLARRFLPANPSQKQIINKIDQGRLKELHAEHEQLNRSLEENELCIRKGLKLKLHPESRNGFEHFCFRSPEMVDEMNCFIELTKQKRCLLDIGALHGIFSLVFASSGLERKVLAVDASPIAFGRLLYNIHKNSFDAIVPIERAVSDDCGTLRMHYEWEHAVAAKSDASEQKYLSVDKETGDFLCRSMAFEPDVIKIDVEGHEIKVMKGLQQTIERKRPLIFLEWHPDRVVAEGNGVEDLIRLVKKYEYRMTLVSGDSVEIPSLRYFSEIQRLTLTPA